MTEKKRETHTHDTGKASAYTERYGSSTHANSILIRLLAPPQTSHRTNGLCYRLLHLESHSVWLVTVGEGEGGSKVL